MKLYQNAGIYALCNRENGSKYVGKDTELGRRAKRHLSLKCLECPDIHAAIKEYGADAFDVELIHYPNISHEALKAVEEWKIKQLGSHRSQGGYNRSWKSGGVDSEKASEINRMRVANGTHNLLGENNPTHRRVADGTHNFLNSEFHRENARDRVENGTHPFLGGEIQREANRQRLADGTHNFLDKAFQSRRTYFQRLKRKAERREFYCWVSVILTAKSVCEERVYRKRTRDGFFDKEIPDTSKAEQINFL